MAFPLNLASVLTGVTPSQLRRLRDRGIIVPEVRAERPPLYSMRDLVALRTIAYLRPEVSFQKISKAFENLDLVHLAEHPSAYRFGTPVKENLTGGVLDLDLFNHLQALGYSAIITMDAHQLDDPAERAALASCGLHWIGFSMTCLAGAGSNALARQTAMILTGLPYVYDHWASTPTAYLLPSMKAEPPAIEPL